MWIIFILRRELRWCWTVRQSVPEAAIKKKPWPFWFTVSRDAQKIMAVSRNRRSVRTDTVAEKGMDPTEKLPLPEAGRAELSEAKQQADMLWQQADGREGGA